MVLNAVYNSTSVIYSHFMQFMEQSIVPNFIECFFDVLEAGIKFASRFSCMANTFFQ